jgi:phage-related minor tail protein
MTDGSTYTNLETAAEAAKRIGTAMANDLSLANDPTYVALMALVRASDDDSTAVIDGVAVDVWTVEDALSHYVTACEIAWEEEAKQQGYIGLATDNASAQHEHGRKHIDWSDLDATEISYAIDEQRSAAIAAIWDSVTLRASRP